jgi:hypothetical protein
MGRTIGAVIAGYLVMFALVFVSFSLAFLVMGAAGAFAAGTYEASGLWLTTSFVLALVAAIAGGRVAAVVGRGARAVRWLAVFVAVIGLAMALPMVFTPGPANVPRPDRVGVMEAMQNARQPGWVALLNPVIGAIGVLVGGRATGLKA